MSRRVADLLIKIGADSYEFQQKTKLVEQGLDGVSKRLTSLGKDLSLKLTAPLAALGTVSVALADTQAKAEAKVQQAIKSTAGAAQLSFEQLKTYASDLQKTTLFGDEKILNDATAQLLTFTNIAGSNFKRTQAVALDLATHLDGDLKSASIQLGKALNDPVKNLSALSRSGIQFSTDQKVLINSLAETGRLAEAQGVILTELERQYGGQAEAAAKVGTGMQTQFKNAVGDLMEMFGSIIQPILNKITEKLMGVVEWLQNLSPATKTTIVTIAGFAAALGPVLIALGSALKLLPLLKSGFMVLIAPIAAARTAIKSLSLAISTNPLGLLLTALSMGVGLWLAFRKGTDDSTEALGKHAQGVMDEGREVNTLIAKLSSANTKEDERRKILEQLKTLQPDIVDGLKAEKIETDKLTTAAQKYNQQLVLRMAMARKQDTVTAALEQQTEAGIQLANKEAALYEELARIQSKLPTAKITAHNGRYGYDITTKERDELIANISAIMASQDALVDKAQKVRKFFTSDGFSLTGHYRDFDVSKVANILSDIEGVNKEVSKAGDVVQQAEDDVRNFANAFSGALGAATEVETGVEGVESAVTKTTTVVKGLGTTTTEQLGIITKLQAQIKTLEDSKLLPTATLEDIAKANTELQKLQEELKRVQSITTEQLNRNNFKISDTIKLEPITAQVEIKLDKKLPDIKKELDPMIETIKAKSEELASTINSAISGAIVAISEGIGQMMAGDIGFGDFMNIILLQMANFLKTLGAQLVEFGVMIVGFKTALKSVLANPWAAIAVGAAMVAAGAVMTVLINKKAEDNVPKLANGGLAYGVTYAMVGDNPNAAVDPEVIAPLSKLKKLLPQGGGTQNVNITLGGQLKAKGRDLVYALGQENFKLNILG